ncbi:MAG TPA: sigma factor, partial [Polyangiales bacterium]|nr:sigma factor [Polyangiales bacterium]
MNASNIGQLHRREYGRMLASLIRVVRDITLAEECLQEAFEAALAQWPVQGDPPNPVAWLMSTARHKAIDQIRRRVMAQEKQEEIAAMITPHDSTSDTPEPTDTLRLIFTC